MSEAGRCESPQKLWADAPERLRRDNFHIKPAVEKPVSRRHDGVALTESPTAEKVPSVSEDKTTASGQGAVA